MKEETTAFGLNKKKLAHLLRLGSRAEDSGKTDDPDVAKSQMLWEYLSHTLPPDGSRLALLPAMLAELCRATDLLDGEPIGSLLEDSGTDLAIIRGVKEYAKLLSRNASSESEHDAATAVYYAAIAHALVHHNVRITRLSHRRLHDAFALLIEAGWVSKRLKSLLREASDCCRKKKC